jgi:VCBS repeat-containing protein
LTGTGEPGATITVTGTGGAVIGTGTVAANGTFSVGLSPAQVNGQELDVTQQDAAGNVSGPATATAPGVDFALTDASDTAILDQTITRQNEATPSTASSTVTALLALSITSLLNVNLGSATNPVVNFNLSGSTNSVDLDLRIGGLVNVGVLSNYSVIIERWNGTAWVRGAYGTDDVNNGILQLNLLGAPTGEITLTDLDAGQYRATLVPNPGITLGIGTLREISVTATDQVENVQISVGERAEGNFIDAAATGNTDDLRIAEVDFNGVTHVLVNGSVTVEGAFGTLVFNADGSYIYTPHTTATAGGTDDFTVVVIDPVTGNELSSDLTIDVEVQDTSAITMASASDETMSLAMADDGGGSDVTDSPDDNARTTADNDTSTDNPDAPDTDTSTTDTSVDAMATDDTPLDGAIADGSDTTVEPQQPVEASLNSDDGLSLLVQGGEEVDLSALDNLLGDTSVTVDGSGDTGVDVSANVDLPDGVDAVLDLVETPPLDPFEPLNQDDDLATQRLPVV